MSEMTPEKLLSEILDHDFDSSHQQQSFSELEERLLQSEDARKEYLASVDLHYMLQCELNVEQIVSEPSNVISIDPVRRKLTRRSISLAISAVAALLVLCWVSVSLLYPDPLSPRLTLESSPDAQLKVTHDSGSSADELTDSVLAVGSRLQIYQGLVELQFETGVRSIIKGPADLTLNKEGDVLMSQGIGWFQVPKGAEGFSVVTPNMKAVDLGTEFGVISNPDYFDELHVFKGSVELDTFKGATGKQRVDAGQAWIIRPQGAEATKLTPEKFATSLPTTPLYLHWSFDEHDGDQLTTRGTHPSAASIQATLHQKDASTLEDRFIPGRFGKGLSFNGDGDSVITDWEGISMDGPRTTAFWTKLSKEGGQYDVGSVAWGMRGHGRKNQKWTVEVSRRKKKNGNNFFVNCSFGGLWTVVTPPPHNDGLWHHVCVTYSGKVNSEGRPDLCIYIDGGIQGLKWLNNKPADVDQQKNARIHTETNLPESMPLIMGSTLHPLPKDRHYSEGDLDEVYVFFRELNQDEVQRLYQNDFNPKSNLER